MNITLLILGVFLILISTILIVINSSNSKDENLKYQAKEDSFTSSLNTEYKKELQAPQKEQETYREQEEAIPIKYVTNAETEVLLREVIKDETSDASDYNQKPTNITERIISLHKEGLSVSQIAARLEKGIREIEIILKVNKLND